MPGGSSPQETSFDRRVGEALEAYLARRRQGTAEPVDEFLSAHPTLADELQEHLDLIDRLRPAQVSVEGLLAQGVLEQRDGAAWLGSYRVVECIGSGGMGIVLQAVEEPLNRPVALKILRPELAADTAALARFIREAQVAAALRHPNIITVHAVGHERGVHFIAMEHVAGPSLADIIRGHGPLPADAIRWLFGQLLEGLQAAHDARLIHRDIKPSNILLERTGNADGVSDRNLARVLQTATVKIADFGLARMRDSQTRLTLEGSTPGTPDYMSPEQARGDANLDHRTDLYSAGVVLYELLTGTTPFKAPSSTAIIHRILHDDPDDPRTITANADRNLASLALRLLAKRPEDRLESAEGSIAALGAGTRVRSKEIRRRRLRLAGLLTMTVVLLGIAWVLSRPDPGPDPGRIRRVAVEKDLDGNSTTVILVSRAGGNEATTFHEFDAKAGSVVGVAFGDLNERGEQFVVAVTHSPLDGNCMFMFDSNGVRLEKLDLTSTFDWPWPECEPPNNPPWGGAAVAVGDLDNQPGHEIVVAAKHYHDYPTLITTINPRTWERIQTFWHMGHVKWIWIEEDFLVAERPAIIFVAENNKLDGFNDPTSEDVERLARHQYVNRDMTWFNAVGILDPQRLQGLGPPRTTEINILPATPYAYAFLNAPCDASMWYRDAPNSEARAPDAREVGVIHSIGRYAPEEEGTGPWFQIRIAEPDTDDVKATIFVDRNLEFQRVDRGRDERWEGDFEAFWRERWTSIVRNYEYVEE